MAIRKQAIWGLVATLACAATGCTSFSPGSLFPKKNAIAAAEPKPAGNPIGKMFAKRAPVPGSNDATSAAVKHAMKPSETMGSKFQQTKAKLANSLTLKPKVVPADDPTSLATKPKKLEAGLYVRAARLHEKQNEPDLAAKNYAKALELEPNNVEALVATARFHDKNGDAAQADATYQRALKISPQAGLIWNDAGLCYARHGQLSRAAEALQRAVETDPTSVRYRNNLAAVLVENQRAQEAFHHLRAVHPEPAANFNVGFLLHRQGRFQEAQPYLLRALQLDPSLAAAEELLSEQGAAHTARQPAPGINQSTHRGRPRARISSAARLEPESLSSELTEHALRLTLSDDESPADEPNDEMVAENLAARYPSTNVAFEADMPHDKPPHDDEKAADTAAVLRVSHVAGAKLGRSQWSATEDGVSCDDGTFSEGEASGEESEATSKHELPSSRSFEAVRTVPRKLSLIPEARMIAPSDSNDASDLESGEVATQPAANWDEESSEENSDEPAGATARRRDTSEADMQQEADQIEKGEEVEEAEGAEDADDDEIELIIPDRS